MQLTYMALQGLSGLEGSLHYQLDGDLWDYFQYSSVTISIGP